MDLIWKRGNYSAGFEIKSTNRWKPDFNKGLNALMDTGDIEQALGISRGDRRLKVGDITALPYQEVIQMSLEGKFA